MSPNLTLALVVGGLFGCGAYLLLQRTLTRVIFGLLLLGHATNLMLLMSGGPAGDVPIVGRFERASDPLAQAFILTAIVITFAVQTFVLTLAYRSWQLSGQDEVQDDVEDAVIARRTDELDEVDRAPVDSSEDIASPAERRTAAVP